MQGGERRRTDGLVALVPVAVAAALIAFCLAGAQLYSSSSGSAALDTQIAETCRTDSALSLPIPYAIPRAEARVAAIGSTIPFVEPPRRLATARPFLHSESALPIRLTLLWIDGVDRNVTPALRPLAAGEIAVSAGVMAQLATEIGGVVAVDGARLTVAQVYDDVAFDPIPDFWCGYPELLRPTPAGDRPPPHAIAAPATIETLGDEAAVFDQYLVVDEPLTLTDGAALRRGYVDATERWEVEFRGVREDVPRNELGRVVARAESVRITVDRNLTPVTLTGVVAGAIVLIAAGVLVARDRHRELRLLAVRGLPPWRIAAHVTLRSGVAIVAGSVTGAVLAWAVITAFGPSSNLERGAIARAIAWVLAATAGATVLVAGVVGFVADGFADVRRRRVHVRSAATVVVIAVVALALVAFRRLDRKGGIRTFGVESRGGDLVAMGYPLFAVLAVTAVAGLGVGFVTPRLRLSGGGLPRPLRLGWRRVVLEAGPLVAVVVSVALAAGCFTVASALAAGSERQLAEKAEVYVGTDLAVDVFDPVEIPPAWEPRTTLIAKTRVEWDEVKTDLIGIDPARFADVTTLRHDGSSQSLDELVDAIDPGATGESGASDEPLRAIAVGSDASIGDVVEVVLAGTAGRVPIRVVATADFFPGKTTQVPMLVVDRAALERVVRFPRMAVLVRDPPPDAVEAIRAGGARTGVILDATTAFDGSAYSALRWAYAPLATLGALFAVVALALQLLVVSARRGQRRVADAVMRRTGFTTRGLWRASLVETGIPLVVGSLVGIGAAIVAASGAVPRLDPMPALAPTARFLMPWDVLVVTICVIPVWTAVISVVIVRSTVGADPMRVFQGSA